MAKTYNDMTGEWEGQDDYVVDNAPKPPTFTPDPNFKPTPTNTGPGTPGGPSTPWTPGAPGTQQPGYTWTADPKQPAGGTYAPTPPTTNSSASDWTVDRVNQYFKGRGVTPNASSPQYWVDRWNEWGKNDPGYFEQRLANADEFNPGRNNGGGGGTTINPGGGFHVPLPPGFDMSQFTGQNQNGMSNPQATALFDMLMGRAKQSLKVDPNDPILRGQSDAYSAQQTRHGRQYLKELAERSGANANIDAEGRMVAEKAAQSSAGFEANLMQQELTSRRQEIKDALAGAAGLLTAEQQLQLQMELKQLDQQADLYKFGVNSNQREGEFARNLIQRQSEFDRDLGQRAYEYDATDRYRNSPLNG